MPVQNTNVSAAALRTLHKKTAGSIQEIIGLNLSAELGSTSVRFKSKDSKSVFGGELAPEQALLELMAGRSVEVTTVTWKTYNSYGKRGVTSSRKVRVKIRNSEVKAMKDVASFEKWWTGVQADGPNIEPSQPRGPSPTRSHGRKR
jgi:hypothetical protein